MAAADYAPLETASALARRCQGSAHALLVGAAPQAAIDRARELGLDTVWVVSAGAAPEPLQSQQLADIFAASLAREGPVGHAPDSLFLVAAGPAGEELAGRLAARLKAVPLGKCKHFEFDAAGRMSVQRAAFGGRLDMTLACRRGPFVAAVRKLDDAAQGQPQDSHATAVCHISPAVPLRPAYPASATARAEQQASLDGAKLVVAGGRGMGGADGFAALYELAARLEGAVGASLPAIDAGWAPVARQVGQSGKYVAPEIYLAIGISGTPQHMAGIAPHTRIIAVNKDPDAGIFQAAQIGVVADWQEFLPALISAWDGAPH